MPPNSSLYKEYFNHFQQNTWHTLQTNKYMEYLGCFDFCDAILIQEGVDNGIYELNLSAGLVKFTMTTEVLDGELVLNLAEQPFFLPEQGRYTLTVSIGGILETFYFDIKAKYYGIALEEYN